MQLYELKLKCSDMTSSNFIDDFLYWKVLSLTIEKHYLKQELTENMKTKKKSIKFVFSYELTNKTNKVLNKLMKKTFKYKETVQTN